MNYLAVGKREWVQYLIFSWLDINIQGTRFTTTLKSINTVNDSDATYEQSN